MTASQARPDVFTVHYVLKNKIGELVDTSEGSEPLHFVYGSPEIIEGIQQAVKDRNVGDCLEVSPSWCARCHVHCSKASRTCRLA